MSRTFNENTRVQVPAAVHLCRLGYRYYGAIAPEEFDASTNILTRRGRRVYGVVRSFYRRCFNRFQMSELEIDLEPFAVHSALTGSGDSPRMGSGDSPRVGIFRRHSERIFQWAENRSVPAEYNMSERGVRRTVIARKVCVRWTRASASLTCSSRCRHTRQNSVGDGQGPVAFTKAGRSRICLSDNGKILKADCGFGLDDSKSCTFAQILSCRGRS